MDVYMNECARFAEHMRGQLVRLYMDYMEGADPDYVYIYNCYQLGDEVWLVVGGNDEHIGHYFRVVKMSEVDTIEYFESDEEE